MPFLLAGGEYVSVSTQKDTEEAAVAREQLLLDKDMDAAKKITLRSLSSKW